jgi:hypothetical protein
MRNLVEFVGCERFDGREPAYDRWDDRYLQAKRSVRGENIKKKKTEAGYLEGSLLVSAKLADDPVDHAHLAEVHQIILHSVLVRLQGRGLR